MAIHDTNADGKFVVRTTVGGDYVPYYQDVRALEEITIEDTCDSIDPYKECESFMLFPISSPSADATVGTNLSQFVVSEAVTIDHVIFTTDPDNPPTGSTAQIDVTVNGTTIFSTNPTIDDGEYSSEDAATPYVFTNTFPKLEVGDIVRFDIDQIGSTTAGRHYKVQLDVYKSV